MRFFKTLILMSILILCFGNIAFASGDTVELTEIDDYDLDTQQLETSYISDVPSLETASQIISFESIPTPRKIIGIDNRKVITNTTKAPYKFIGKLIIEYSNGKAYGGTGFLVGESTIVTAAHCAYSRDLNAYPTKITFYPGRTGSNNPYGSTTVKKIHVPTKFKTNSTYDTKYDYAVLELNSPIGKKTGFFEQYVICISDVEVTYSAGYIVGYNGNTLYSAHGETTIYPKQKKIIYKIDTDSGQSGAPIYEKSTLSLYGIHTSGSTTQNTGRYITEEVTNLISKYS